MSHFWCQIILAYLSVSGLVLIATERCRTPASWVDNVIICIVVDVILDKNDRHAFGRDNLGTYCACNLRFRCWCGKLTTLALNAHPLSLVQGLRFFWIHRVRYHSKHTSVICNNIHAKYFADLRNIRQTNQTGLIILKVLKITGFIYGASPD